MDLYFDIVCPFAYLAATRAAAIAEEAGVALVWRPILSGRSHGPDAETAMAEAKRCWVRADAAYQAERFGVPLVFPEDHPRRTVDAMRLLTAAPPGVVPALAGALYRAYWVEGRDVGDRAVLAEIAAAHGLDIGVIDHSAVQEQLQVATRDAMNRGVFDVPTVMVDGRRFWGSDRLPFVREALGLSAESGAVVPTARPGGAITFFHDLASPFSYLASTGVEALAARAGATLEWKAILVGAVFNTIGTPLVPMSTFSTIKASYYAEDLQRWAQRRGVPFQFTTHFPIRTVVANRVTLVEPRTIPALYRAAWAENRPISDAAQVRAVLDGAGFDGASLLAQAEDPHIKETLRRNTDDAVRAGVCGVPSFIVQPAREPPAPVPIWGQDRMDLVERLLGAP